MRTTPLIGLTAILMVACISEPVQVSDLSLPYITAEDFKIVEGDNWIGSLTYLDYSADKRVTIPASSTVKVSSPTTIKYTISYPEEPWEDTRQKIKISKLGDALDGHKVISRDIRSDGNLEIQTENRGEDDGKAAEIRMTYILGEKAYSFSKDVKVCNETDFINRNIYSFTRN